MGLSCNICVYCAKENKEIAQWPDTEDEAVLEPIIMAPAKFTMVVYGSKTMKTFSNLCIHRHVMVSEMSTGIGRITGLAHFAKASNKNNGASSL